MDVVLGSGGVELGKESRWRCRYAGEGGRRCTVRKSKLLSRGLEVGFEGSLEEEVSAHVGSSASMLPGCRC